MKKMAEKIALDSGIKRILFIKYKTVDRLLLWIITEKQVTLFDIFWIHFL